MDNRRMLLLSILYQLVRWLLGLTAVLVAVGWGSFRWITMDVCGCVDAASSSLYKGHRTRGRSSATVCG
jgi:hypothetical protein